MMEVGLHCPTARRQWSLASILLPLIACVCACSGPVPPSRSGDGGDSLATPAAGASVDSGTLSSRGNGIDPPALVDESEASPDAGQPDRKGEDWPQFLGPRGTSVSGESNVLPSWPKDGPAILWEKTVGTGYSAPSIRGNRLIIHHRLGSKEIVECLRADDGSPVWKHDYRSQYSDPFGYNNGPRCSPLLTEDRCYTYGAEGKLVCVDLGSGKPLWTRDVQADWKLPMWFFGIGCSPILEGDLLIALVGGQPNSGVVAFNRLTGDTVWEAVGKQTWDGAETGRKEEPKYEWTGDEQVISYSSPWVATIHGKRHLLVLGRQGLVSLDPATGKENFHYWFMSRSFESVNAARPLVVDDQILLTAAYKSGSALLKVRPDGTSYDVVWRDEENLQAHWSTPIIVNGYFYGFSGRHEREGELRCLELKTGDVVWKTTGFEGELSDLDQDPSTGDLKDRRTGKAIPFPYYGRGSKTQIGDRFLVLGERGTLSLVRINPEKWEELGRTSYRQITYPAWTAPVVSRGRIYLRDEDSLICLEGLVPAAK